MRDERKDEDDDEEFWGSLRRASRKWPYGGEVGEPMEDGAGAGEGGGLLQKEVGGGDTEFTAGLDVKLKEEHPDGSATFAVTADEATMSRIFEAFFVQALIAGLEATRRRNDDYVREARRRAPWVGLTEADIYEAMDDEDHFDFARAIEAKLKERNT